ncbi:MAG TPA: serine/threonine-protein kinase [Pyrinomonadaceae bacterium]|nr:serine/threonine-protein kinase [Pyrinomonadaceae bacterium]
MKKCPTCGKEYEDTNTLCPSDGTVLKKTGDDALIGQLLAGKYRIEEKIDEGGMGCVYRATHVLMEKRLAIKVLHPALAADDKIVARFTREAKAASRISHPHALTVTDFGESEQGVVFLVMEYLNGRTLKDVIRHDGQMPLSRVAEIVRQVSGALEAAHEQGVVHRDLKSDNIMLEETSGGDWAKVLDFGIAKIQEAADKPDPGLTAPNLIIGTPQYMSPEQCSQASDIDTRSDIYSLGIIVYEMLAGHVPFTGDSPTAIMMKHIQEPPPSILEERPELPAEVGRVVARALAKNPVERFQKAGELSDALAVAATGVSSAVTNAVTAAGSETDRISATTAPNEVRRTTASADAEEVTVVSGASRFDRGTSEEELPPIVAPLPAESFNPWRIALPAIAALAVVFAVVFAFQRSRSAEGETPALNSDPNSQPVQSITPPTGQAESNLAPVGTQPSPTTSVEGGTQPASGGENTNAGASASPAPAEGAGQNTNQAAEEGEEEEEPTPPPANRNTNRRNPTLNTNIGDDPPPPPAPTPAKKNPPAPEVPPDAAPQTGDAPLPALSQP